jgi:glucokinase
MSSYYLGVEIGGTKLQLGVGADDGALRALWRGTVDVAAGPEGIRRQILAAFPEVLGRAALSRDQLRGVGVGFGGPIDDATRTVIRSHQIAGWDGFPLADWVSDMLGLPAVLGNDADVAGLAEALHGAGKGLSPIFYITIGSGIGGGFIIGGEIYRGAGRGAAEIGHLLIGETVGSHSLHYRLESRASGWGIERFARTLAERNAESSLHPLADRPGQLTATRVAEEAKRGDRVAARVLDDARQSLASAIRHVILLLCPRRIVIGGGVSLLGEEQLFAPLRELLAQHAFPPFAGLTDIVPAALGEEVVVHGAVALARKKLA